MESAKKLPPDWIEVKSKSHPGKVYYFNIKNKQAVWKLSDLLKPEKPGKMKSPPKRDTGVSNKSKTIVKRNLAEARMKNLKAAFEKEKNDPGSVRNNVPTSEKKQLPIKPKEIVKIKQPSPQKKRLDARKRVEGKSPVKSQKSVECMDVEMEPMPQEKLNIPEDYAEPMDWEEIAIEEVVKEVNNIRTIKMVPSSLKPYDASDEINDDKFYVVVDTNVFCSNPSFIDRIKGRQFKDIGKACIFVPYIVLCELDMLKTRDGNISKAAQRGIKTINEYFQAKDPHVGGQSTTEDARELIAIDSGDDRILNCAFQLKITTNKILILSDDINLRNKAFVNGFEAYSTDMLNYADFNNTGRIKFD